MEVVVKESYEKEIECKFFLDVDISEWKFNMKYEKKVNVKLSCYLCWLSKMGEDFCFICSSVKEKRRIVVEVRLKMEVLEEKQSLECCLEEEEVEFKRREFEFEEERK